MIYKHVVMVNGGLNLGAKGKAKKEDTLLWKCFIIVVYICVCIHSSIKGFVA